jgi:hypothetical protein
MTQKIPGNQERAHSGETEVHAADGNPRRSGTTERKEMGSLRRRDDAAAAQGTIRHASHVVTLGTPIVSANAPHAIECHTNGVSFAAPVGGHV